MAFCTNCGKELVDGAKFCAFCGTANEKSNTKREIVFEGKVHKCPSCGEVLDAFVATCPVCGHELRDASNSEAVHVFASRLVSAKTVREKAEIIRNFPIPNTKEDILEFMILASTNIDNKLEPDLYSAWQVKTEQAYQKAQIVFQKESELSRIQNIYEKVSAKLAKQKKQDKVKKAGNILAELMPVLPNVIIVTGWLISIFVLLPLCRVNLDSVGTNGYQIILMLDFIAGAIFIPFAFKANSSLPKIIAALGLILSILVLIPLCGENLDDVGTNAFQIILMVDIVCSVIILIRMLKRQGNVEKTKGLLNGVVVLIAFAFVAIMLIAYGISSVVTAITVTNETAEKEQEHHQAISVKYEWPITGLSQYLPLPPTQYGEIQTDNETRFNIDVYQVTPADFDLYAKACEEKGFTINTTKTDQVFYAYHEEKYEISIFYYEDEETLKIYLDAPEQMSDIKWPTIGLAQKLPVPDVLVGRIWHDSSEQFGVDLAEVTQEVFDRYIDACMEKGFTVDYRRSASYFNAYNKEGEELTLSLQIFDVMEVSIKATKKE